MSESGWAVTMLATAENDELAAEQTTVLTGNDFDKFVVALDAPEDPRMAALLAREPIWK